MHRSHVVITGTGRAGTTFLVQLLTLLGLDTGYTTGSMPVNALAKAGLEHDIRMDNAPYIVKSPWFALYADEVIQQRKDITIDHVFIPMRDLHAAAESRRRVVNLTKSALSPRKWRKVDPAKVPGGLFLTKEEADQETALLQVVYKLALALAPTTIPVTLLHYPKLVQDSEYLYSNLKPILKDISYARFEAVYNDAVVPTFVHSFNGNDR